MFSVYRVRHCQFIVFIVLNKRIKAAGVHFRLQNHFTVRNISGIDFFNAYMSAVNVRVKQAEISVVQ